MIETAFGSGNSAMKEGNPHNLHRFLNAQDEDYEFALEELRHGRKESHWIWYIFPQVAGLGSSSMAQSFAIRSGEEAVAYLDHATLGQRLRECCEALLPHRESPIEEIMGYPDDLKLRSSMTLFATVSPNDLLFRRILDAFFAGQEDERTIEFLNPSREN